MKKKLFAVAMVVLLYSFFVVAFSIADNQGQISKVLSDVGLSNASTGTTPSTIQNDLSGSDISSLAIDPLPDPTRPRPKPKP